MMSGGRALQLIVVAGSLAMAGNLAGAPDVASPAVARIGAVVGDTPDSAVIIGSSGQLYHPVGGLGPPGALGAGEPASPQAQAQAQTGQPGTWQRHHGGGVAADVTGVVYVPGPGSHRQPPAGGSSSQPATLPGQLFAAGRRTPLYHFQDGVWHVYPIAYRGTVVVPGAGSAPSLAVNRTILVWRSNAFRRLRTAKGPVTALFATSHAAVYAATASGNLDLLRAGSTTPVRLPLADDDPIEQLAGRRGAIYGISRSGAIVRIRGRNATLVSREPALAGLVAQAASVAADGTLWAAGVVLDGEPDAGVAAPSGPGGESDAGAAASSGPDSGRLIVARTHDGGLVQQAAIELVTPGDHPIAVIAGATGELLVVTAAGVVHYREPGASWQNGTILRELPPSSASRSGPGPASAR